MDAAFSSATNTTFENLYVSNNNIFFVTSFLSKLNYFSRIDLCYDSENQLYSLIMKDCIAKTNIPSSQTTINKNSVQSAIFKSA